MGLQVQYLCGSCGHSLTSSAQDTDCGMSGVMVTAVLCVNHGVTGASTGSHGWDPEPAPLQDEYPCGQCGRPSARWDRRTCPQCGRAAVHVDPQGAKITWD